jgi:hypothetical protein
MESIAPPLRDVVGHQLGLVLQTAEARVLPNTRRRYRRWFEIWKQFLHSLGPIYPSHTPHASFLHYAKTDLERVQMFQFSRRQADNYREQLGERFTSLFAFG